MTKPHATRRHIHESVRYALWEKTEIATKSDCWYAAACTISREWRDDARRLSIKALARRHLNYWRMRAFLGTSKGEVWDRPAHRSWHGTSEQEREHVT